MNGIGILIGVYLALSSILQLGVAASVGYLLFKATRDEDSIVFKLPGPGKPISDGMLLIPEDKAEGLVTSIAQENKALYNAAAAGDKPVTPEAADKDTTYL